MHIIIKLSNVDDIVEIFPYVSAENKKKKCFKD